MLYCKRSLRRIARHDEPEFSNASILNSMEKFVRTVSEMEDTILVPSRLLDLSVGDAGDTICMKGKRGYTVQDTLANTDLYRLYNIINQMKIELLWSQKPTRGTEMDDQLLIKSHPVGSPSAESHHYPVTVTGARLGHVRCPSTTSMQSVQSASSIASTSDSDSEVGIEIDSGLEGEECADLASIAAQNFKRHLRGLHHNIARMTEAAEYLTLRYQADVGGQV
ncbi:mid1-interacting protein 1 isoform X2 [Polyergus mexicanus]|uniref:mid1-interacting protein 1 isoform X2 n=1 Tax=Polyergus mexicanus TaxID=615972 RepID=UPI0038B59BCE